MFTILNRYRGTYGWFAKIVGVVLGLLTYLAWGNIYVSIAVTIGYAAGESFGWGEWIGNLTGGKKDTTKTLEDEGVKNGIQWLSKKIVPNYQYEFIKYCRVALTLRGFYWWLPTLSPLYFISDAYTITLAIILLSFGFPLACELGYRTSPLFSLEYKTFSVKGGWEHQEIWYGLMQDIVLIGVVLLA